MFFFGREKELSTLDSHIQEVISIIAKLETKIDIPDVHLLITKLNQVKEFIIRENAFFPNENKETIINGLSLLCASFEPALNYDYKNTLRILSEDPWFKQLWGSPVHFALFRKYVSHHKFVSLIKLFLIKSN